MQVRLDMLIGDYVRNAKTAASATESIGTAAQKPKSALDRIGEAAKDVGKTVTAVAGVGVAALAAWGAGAFAAGAAYNSLQQTANSALETLLGSAEAATAQMEELAAFASTSPFPRQMWIQAQQTLIGFGVEAERVVPIFSALQDGIVAVGGSAQQIEEVVLILSKISSVGKVTAEDLNQLGERGIDAASLVGQAWGMTAADVRDSMSKGAVDATNFMDTLVDQLGEKYAGAAEGLRTTWVGALDRIAGATRDIGSILAAPFIDPQGGGAAVEWANAMADALRAVESILRPAAATLADRAEPAFQAAAAAIQRFTEAVRGIDLVAVLDRIAAGAPVFAAFGAAALAAGSASALSAVGLGSLAGAINPVAAGILGLAAASPAFRDALGDLMMVIAPLIPVITDLAIQIAEGLTLAVDSLMPFVQVAIGLVGGMVALFAELPGPVQQAAIAVGVFALALKKLGPLGMILTSIGYIATAVSSISSSSVQASLDVNDLTEDLENFRNFGRTFKLDDTDFAAITGPLREAIELSNKSLEPGAGGWADMTQTGKEWITVGEHSIGVTREMLDANGELIEYYRRADVELGGWADSLTAIDQAMAQQVKDGEDAGNVWRNMAAMMGLTNDEFELLVPLLTEYNSAAELQAATAEEAADAQAEFADQVGRSVAALQELADELRAQVDPVFAAVRAMREYEDAQEAHAEAVEKYGASSEEALETGMALTEAFLETAAAAGEMAKATGGELPIELLLAAEAAGLSADSMAALEEAFYATRDGGQVMAEDLAGFNGDLSTSTGRMAAQNALELAGMEADYAGFVLNAKQSVDDLMASGMSYSEAIAFVAANSSRSTSEIEAGFEEARAAGLEFSDDYPATTRLTGVDQVISALDILNQRISSMNKTVTISFQHRGFQSIDGISIPGMSTGGPVEGPFGAGDVVPRMLQPGEHVWTVDEVQGAGGHAGVAALRAAALAGQTRVTHSWAPIPTQRAGRSGITVENVNIETINERLDARQVQNELYLLAVS